MKYYRTLKGKITSIYFSQRNTCKNRNRKLPEYSLEDFRKWCMGNEKFMHLYNNWVKSDFDKNLAPSIDRLDDYKTYSFDNVQVLTWSENCNKQYSDRINGINNKKSKAIMCFSKDNKLLKEYYSISEAQRDTGICKSNIIGCAKGERNTAGGLKWKYNE